MSRWLKEPLLHFLILGALIFGVYGWLSDERSADEVFISTGQQDNLINTFERTWQRPPTAAEFVAACGRNWSCWQRMSPA
jgi:hypothetical protein